MKRFIYWLVTCLIIGSLSVAGLSKTFTKEKWLSGIGWGESEAIDVCLRTGSEGLQVLDCKCYQQLFSVHWDTIRRLSYSSTKYPRVSNVDFVLNLFSIPTLHLKYKKHWLVIEHKSKITVFRLNKSTRDSVIREFEERSDLVCEELKTID